MTKPRFDTTAVVLGMHRSGTSALAGVLAQIGFVAPKTLLPTSSVNERGFWESERVKALDDELFAEFGMSWHSLKSISFDALSDKQLRSMGVRVEAVLREEFAAETGPIIKDPRLCRLLPLWKPALGKLARGTIYPIALRNPTEIAQSLMQRNEFDADLSYLLWARYYLDAEFHTRGLPRSWISFDDLLDDWRGAVRKISSDTGTKLTVDAIAQRKVGSFLSDQLRHHRREPDQAYRELDRLPLVRESFEVLLAWSRGKSPNNEDFLALDKARQQFDTLSGAIARVVENARLDRKRLSSAKAQSDEISAELSRARRTAEDLGTLRAMLDRQSEAQSKLEHRLEQAVASLTSAVQDRKVLEEQLASSIASGQQQRAGLEQIIADARREAAAERSALQQQIVRIQAETANERAALENMLAEAGRQASHATDEAARERLQAAQLLAEVRAKAEADQMLAEDKLAQALIAAEAVRDELARFRADAVSAAENSQRRHAKAKAELENAIEAARTDHQAVETELKDVKRKYRSTQHQLARDREKLKRTQEQLTQAEESLSQLRQTWVWRSYEGLAGVAQRSTAIVSGGRRKIRKRRSQSVALLRESALFDADWYLARYPDVAASNIDPVSHYLESGWREGRDPGPAFSTTAYLKANADVARSDLNPLLHFIEFGYSEGRSIAERARPTENSAVAAEEQFGPAAPCASFPVPYRSPTRWVRSARLTQDAAGACVIDEEVIGTVTSDTVRTSVTEAFVRLAALSGKTSRGPTDDASGVDAISASQLSDAWFVDGSRLRSRWLGDAGPVVIRAYQHDVTDGGRLTLVGEALAGSAIDFIDARLANPYFPLLFVLSDPGGAIRSCELLSFPSLCRGGAHYPEFVALERSGNSGADVIAVSEILAGRLRSITSGQNTPLISKLLVDLRGADGSETLFQDHFRSWLSNVIGVGMESYKPAASTIADPYLNDRVRLGSKKRVKAGELVISADAVPAIGCLTMASKQHEGTEFTPLPLIVADNDPSQPATLINLPASTANALDEAAPDHARSWPRLARKAKSREAHAIDAVAIRYPKRAAPTDSEVLIPVAAPRLNLGAKRPGLTWLLFPEDWDAEVLSQGLTSLAFQDGGDTLRVMLVGTVQPSTVSEAKALFDGRVSLAPDVPAAVQSVKTPLLGYIGSRVILHDKRTSNLLGTLLSDPKTMSASCPLVITERRGKGWHVSVADAGAITGTSDVNGLQDVLHFWRATYPALRPPRDLWVGRSSAVKGWLERAGPFRPEEGVQVCSSLVTASYAGSPPNRPAHLRPPASAESQSLYTEALHG